MNPTPDLLYFNGIDGSTGNYSLPPMTPKTFSDKILGTPTDEETIALKNWYLSRSAEKYGITEGHDPTKLDESGWGVVFPVDIDPAVVEALRPLLDWRKGKAGPYYKEYSGGMGGVRPDDTKANWLARQGLPNYGSIDPKLMPYYLLLVGSPQQIDYRFQSLLDVQNAVGRIYFDTPAEYAAYAQSVVQAEKTQLKLQRKISFFGTANPDDLATGMSSDQLVKPLVDYVTHLDLKNQSPWQVQAALKENATKQRLAQLLGGADTSALLFTASHGIGFPSGDAQQPLHQGALLCQNWPGPNQWHNPIPQDFYFSADDLTADAKLWGTLAFFFACYGAGTPQWDEFSRQSPQRMQIAPNPFVARLPQKMLTSGALAVVGHVERAWGYSFVLGKAPALTDFQSSLYALMVGEPIGHALECFNERYAQISTDLTDTLDNARWQPVDPWTLTSIWTANNDSKNYVILGDPAVRAMVAPQPSDPTAVAAAQMPVINLPVKTAAVPVAAPAAVPVAQSPAVQPLVPVGSTPSSYGLGTDIQNAASALGASLQQFIQKAGEFLNATIDAAATLEIYTYTSDSMDTVDVKPGGQVSGGKLRALTAIRIDGDTQQVVPLTQGGELDGGLWTAHMDMVRQAQESRAELIKAAVEAVASLINPGVTK